ncbi:MAG: anthranilate synthase component I [Planctomycetota bacterium]|nr:anthranilate synthase component I [Planctomycetota bacterium]
MSDRLTPVLAYRALVCEDDRMAPSFLFESVEQGGGAARVGRSSILGVRPRIEIVARGDQVTVRDHQSGTVVESTESDPLAVPRRIAADRPLGTPDSALPDCFTGGWIGYIGYDSVRWMEPAKIPFENAPDDDRHLPDMHLGLYEEIVVFDHVSKMIHVLVLSDPGRHDSLDRAYSDASNRLQTIVDQLSGPPVSLTPGFVDLDVAIRGELAPTSNFERSDFEEAVEQVREYIRAGDAFQVVLSQRFRRRTTVDPFDVYRALRVVNPSPYQIYLQAEGCMLVAASPEILCRVRDGVVTSRPLAGTRPRGSDQGEDERLERELLSDDKERAEHVMLVDLARNDLGRACETASISIDACMEIERYSHVMHISSTVTGRLKHGLDQWDALRATRPVGTVSGAPNVRAMEIIDEMEPTRRGPYAGGIGAIGLGGGADIALALRTMVITPAEGPEEWVVDLQAGAGIVLDSDPASEYQETVNKSAALGRAIDLAERSFPPK